MFRYRQFMFNLHDLAQIIHLCTDFKHNAPDWKNDVDILKRGNKKRDKLKSLSLLILCTPAESRTHADNQQVANYFVTNPHLVTNSFQTGNKRLKISSHVDISISYFISLTFQQVRRTMLVSLFTICWCKGTYLFCYHQILNLVFWF